MANLTPMMSRYMEIKAQYPDTIVFFRLGDFYEMFFDDAKTASGILNIALTGRSCGQEERAPMCGVPFHAADTYIARLVNAGYKVAVCEQSESKKDEKGLVHRDVVRVITPGTILDDELLKTRALNYMCCIYMENGNFGVTFCEASTGEMLATSFTREGHDNAECVIEEISRFSPVEIIINIEAHENPVLSTYLREASGAHLELYNDIYFEYDYTQKAVKQQFGDGSDKLNRLTTCSSGAVLAYIAQTQRISPSHIKDIEVYSSAQYMMIDSGARRNLELIESGREKTKRGSLFWALDDTKTPMGSRTLKGWIIRPLMNCARISARLVAVSELHADLAAREALREELAYVSDIERITARISMGTANARDLARLRESLRHLPRVKELMAPFGASSLLKQLAELDALEDVFELLCRSIVDEPPISLRDGGIIRESYSEELDKLACAKNGGRIDLDEIERQEQETTGIKNLKIKYNKVFGYYIEISNANADKVPDYYIRKQTVANGERYITPKLKEVEDVVLGAAERIVGLEYKLFTDIRLRIAAESGRLKKTAMAIGTADALCSLASVAARNNYCCPVVDAGDKIEIKNGRHPVVEKVLKNSLFVPNDTNISTGENRLFILTGPNMAGKSTYMRQVALIAIMAQMGSFVPAEGCHAGITDKVFTRVGSSDDLSAGQSTFMVEMSEVASILKNATPKSLIILDEIGRGTSTYDGLSIAWAVLEYCVSKIGAKTLFATHYHELTQLEDKMEGVVNFSVAVKKRDDDIIFLRKIVKGGADESYGIEVAKLAGVPEAVSERAKKILRGIESEGSEITVVTKGKAKKSECREQFGLADVATSALLEEIKKIDPNVLSPIEAMNVLFDITKKANAI